MAQIQLLATIINLSMRIQELIEAIRQKHSEEGIEVYSHALESEILQFEKQTNFPLPDDFKEFYLFCNGFGCTEDIFHIIQLRILATMGQTGFILRNT